MRLKDYGTYAILISHLGNKVITGDSLSLLPTLYKEHQAYAYVILINGKIVDVYGIHSHIMDHKTGEVDWTKV